MSDWNNDYTYAGKGAKERVRRERLTIENIPKRIARARPYKYAKPENEKPHRNEARTQGYMRAIGIKARIRHLVLDHDMSYLDICATMKKEGVSITGITVSAIRARCSISSSC